MKRIAILGATGSIGCSTLDLVERAPDQFEVVALTAGSNVEALASAAKRTRARFAAIADSSLYSDLKEALSGTDCEAAAGAEAMCEAAAGDADLVMAAIVGCAGLLPTMAGVEAGKTVALANKEALVTAGELMTGAAARSGAALIPVDSEHNAIFQCLAGSSIEDVSKIVLTASGGPFLRSSDEQLRAATPQQAVAHPKWSMGAKISVDSATLMNKGLELIEAHHLFGLSSDRIDVVVHPQSVVHSLVEFRDGSLLAQLGTADMRIPIAYALAWPKRMETPATRLDLISMGQLNFEAPDLKRFPALRLAREALEAGAYAPIVLNAANEVAVARFLGGEIRFTEITDIVERALSSASSSKSPATIGEVMQLDRSTRESLGPRTMERCS